MALTPVSSLALESALTEPSANTEIKGILNSVDGGVVISVPGPATALPATGSLLVKNTYYAEDTTNGEAFLLPTKANSTAGDWIIVKDTAGIPNGEAITIGSAANGDLAVGCHLTGLNADASGGLTSKVDISVATDNSVILAGLTNGAGGAGSFVAFSFNGTEWTAAGSSYSIGNGSALTVGTAAMRFAATA